MASAPRLEQAIGNALLTGSQLVVDLSSVQFIDSSTIDVLIKMKREADNKGCGFSLVLDGSPNIERTLEICRVLGALNRVASVDAAISRNGDSSPKPPADRTAAGFTTTEAGATSWQPSFPHREHGNC